MESTSLIRKILFYLLVVLTIVFIYVIFFPRRSYVDDRFNGELNSLVNDVFYQNINSMFIAGKTYFLNSDDKNSVSLGELIESNLLVDLMDSDNKMCDNDNSYIEKKGNDLFINLSCPNKQEVVNRPMDDVQSDKLFCIYSYTKKIDDVYTSWGEFSDWQIDEVKEDELTNVETKVVSLLDGSKVVTESRDISIAAYENTRISCPNGYYLDDNKCRMETYLNSINASITYTCPSGYDRKGMHCYLNNSVISASKKYFCTNYNGLELRLNGDKCDVYRINYISSNQKEKFYTCPDGYNLSNNKCLTVEYYDKTVDNYKDVTYYRYQKRKKVDSKMEIKWSRPNDKELLNDGFVMDKKITCEI
ncbi:MAG: hypothetical protein J6D28_04935 [Bacilli bacterium]|nr:hypothetical protein [Bacilli bacterium]